MCVFWGEGWGGGYFQNGSFPCVWSRLSSFVLSDCFLLRVCMCVIVFVSVYVMYVY